MTHLETIQTKIAPEDIQLAIAYALDGDFEPYKDLLYEEPEFGVTDEAGKPYANVALDALTFHYGHCSATATAPSSYPPGLTVQIKFSTLSRIVASFAMDSVQ